MILTGCGGAVKEAKIEMEEPVKSFLESTLKPDYSFYALESDMPVTMDDLRSNGILAGSRIPDGLLPANVIGVMYGGGFVNGTMVTLDEKTNGMDKFDGIKLIVAVGITPDGCVNSLREEGVKRVVLFSDDDIKRVTGNDLVELAF